MYIYKLCFIQIKRFTESVNLSDLYLLIYIDLKDFTIYNSAI